jgi:hypothetical protein
MEYVDLTVLIRPIQYCEVFHFMVPRYIFTIKLDVFPVFSYDTKPYKFTEYI